MTRNTIFAAIMFGIMSMFVTSANAQGRHGGMGVPRAHHEMRMGDHGMRGGEMRHHDMGPRHDMAPHHGMGPRHEMHMGGHGHLAHHADYRWDSRGYLHGWDGRVRRFDDGRWGYLRDGAWYYYDCFYEPDYYFAHPLTHFHDHIFHSRGARRVVGAAIGAIAVAALVDALVD